MCMCSLGHKLKPNIHCDGFGGEAFGRWLGNKGRAFMKGLDAMKETPERSLFFPQCKDTKQEEDGLLWTRKLAPADIEFLLKNVM